MFGDSSSSGGWGGGRSSSSGSGRGRGFFRGGRGGRGSFNNSGGGDGGLPGAGLQSSLLSAGDSSANVLCKFFVRSGECRNGDGCKFSHNTVVVALSVPAHGPKALKAIGSLTTPDGLKVLTGSSDQTVKIWNFSSKVPSLDISIPMKGPVEHIDVNENTITCATLEPLLDQQPKVAVGMLHLFNTSTLTTVVAKRSEDFPYTHPQKIRTFITTKLGGVLYVITGGGEGNIRTWRFDEAKNSFEPISLLEGHIREVTGLLLVSEATVLWSSSADHSIRVWEMSSGRCMGVLPTNEMATCLELIPAPNADGYIASGTADGEVKLWGLAGELAHTCSHKGQFVSCLRVFQDSLGGQPVLLIGMVSGGIVARTCSTMSVVFVIDSQFCNTQTVWAIRDLGQSCFATGGDDGNLLVWKVMKPLQDK